MTGHFSAFSQTRRPFSRLGARPVMRFGRKRIQSTRGPVLSFLNHMWYWRRMPRPSSVTPSSNSSVTTASGGGGVRPNISRSKIRTISARRAGHSEGSFNLRPSANVSGSSSV